MADPILWTSDADGRDATTVDGVRIWRWRDASGRWGVTHLHDGPGLHVGATGHGPAPDWDALARWVAASVRGAP